MLIALINCYLQILKLCKIVENCGRMCKKRQQLKILTYGLRYADFAPQRELFALRDNGDIEIIGEIGYDPADEEIFYCRKSFEEGLKLPYDMILVCGNSLRPVIDSFPVDAWDKVELLDEFVKPYHVETERQQVRILKEIIGATDEQIADRDWLRERLFRYGTFPFFKLAKEPQPGVHFSTSGIQQVPDEFLDFCLSISDLKCEKAIEIGVARGGSSYVMAALLYRRNPEMTYEMVDIVDSLVHFEEAKAIIPSLEKRIPHTSDDFKGQQYDFCFIDADHSYEGIMTDWRNVGQYSKVCVFHDIYAHEYDAENGGAVRGWQEIKAETASCKQVEFTKYPDKWMGIGVVEK